MLLLASGDWGHTIAEKRYIALEQFTLGKGSMEEVMKFF